MIRTFLAAAFALMFLTPVSASDIFNLQCNLVGKSGPSGYVFHFDIPAYYGDAHIIWINRLANFDLKYVKSDDKIISGALEMNDFIRGIGGPKNADTMFFKFFRITGEAEIDYLQKPQQTGPNPPTHGFELLMEEFTEKGSCTKVDRAF